MREGEHFCRWYEFAGCARRCARDRLACSGSVTEGTPGSPRAPLPGPTSSRPPTSPLACVASRCIALRCMASSCGRRVTGRRHTKMVLNVGSPRLWINVIPKNVTPFIGKEGCLRVSTCRRSCTWQSIHEGNRYVLGISRSTSSILSTSVFRPRRFSGWVENLARRIYTWKK